MKRTRYGEDVKRIRFRRSRPLSVFIFICKRKTSKPPRRSACIVTITEVATGIAMITYGPAMMWMNSSMKPKRATRVTISIKSGVKPSLSA